MTVGIFVLPYIEMSGSIEFGPWRVAPLQSMDAAWLASPLGEWYLRIAASFRSPVNQPISNPTIVVRLEGMPELADDSEREDERHAMRDAIAFAVVNQGDDFEQRDLDRRYFTTSENATLWMMDVELHNTFLAVERGGLIQQNVSGLRLGDAGFSIPAPDDLLQIVSVELDAELCAAAYESGLAGIDPAQAEHSAVAGAINWYLKAWDNSFAIQFLDRIVFLNTALEALSGTDATSKSASTLEDIYHAGRVSFMGRKRLLITDDLTTTERPSARSGKLYTTTVFGDWFWTLAEARNRIIHQSRVPEIVYRRTGSPFEGNLFWVGERVVRELIRIRLAQLGYPRTLLSRRGRALADLAAEQGQLVNLVAQV